MSRGEKRSTRSLLRKAKNILRKYEETPRIMVAPDLLVRVNNNKRNHSVPEYVKFFPAEFMAWWITSTNAKRKASNYLLHYLKFKLNAKVPLDNRTLLNTPRNPVAKIIFPGSYIHLGVSMALHRLLSEAGTIQPQNILMQFFIDGVSVKRSTKDLFWIVMINIRNASPKRLIPKVVSLYYGKKKVTDFK